MAIANLKDREMTCGKFQKISFYRVLLWSAAFFILGESFNHEFTAMSRRSELSEDSWMCLVSLDQNKVCDCFSDCPGDVDEAYCHTQVLDDQIPSFPGAPIYEERFRYHKCCPLLGEGDLKESNISPQAIKFCQSQKSDSSNKFSQSATAMYRKTKAVFPKPAPAYDNISYAVKRIGTKMAKRDGFDCDENKRQIPFNYVCDGEPDCLDGSDENDTLCSMMG